MDTVELVTNEWKIYSGLRFLRMNHPDDAEYEYFYEHELVQQHSQLIRDGRITALQPHNLRRRQLNGIIRYISIFPEDGGGRSWAGEIPERFANLPMLDVCVEAPETLFHVHRAVDIAASQMPPEIRTPVTN